MDAGVIAQSLNIPFPPPRLLVAEPGTKQLALVVAPKIPPVAAVPLASPQLLYIIVELLKDSAPWRSTVIFFFPPTFFPLRPVKLDPLADPTIFKIF